MEKTIVFGPLILFFGFFTLLIIGFVILIGKLISKAKNSSWEGEIIKKEHNTTPSYDDDIRDNHFYYLVVKMNESGEERKIGLSEKLWSQFKVGEKIKKPKGKLFPEKI